MEFCFRGQITHTTGLHVQYGTEIDLNIEDVDFLTLNCDYFLTIGYIGPSLRW